MNFKNHIALPYITVIILQHAVKYHKTSQKLHMTSSFPIAEHLRHDVSSSKKQKKKYHTKLTTIIAAIAATSPIHQDTLNAQLKCGKCGYYHN